MHTEVTAPASMFGALDDSLTSAQPVDAGPMAEMLSAARQLLGAWDRAMSQWSPTSRPSDLAPDSSLARKIALGEQAAVADAYAGPALTAQLLDGFQVWIGADQVRGLPQGKTRSLLKLLLLQRRRPLSRARLCGMLWPDADADGARNSLNVTLHRLRRVLGDASLVRCTDQGYQLVVAGDVWLDTEQFMLHAEMGRLEDAQGRTANAIGQYEAAMALYRSDLLDEGEREPALAADAQALRDRLNQLLERLAWLREDAGDWHNCLRVALRHLRLDECNEEAHRRLMRCYARLGQPQLAERQYRACVATLRQRFGVSPVDETTRLYRHVTSRSAP